MHLSLPKITKQICISILTLFTVAFLAECQLIEDNEDNEETDICKGKDTSIAAGNITIINENTFDLMVFEASISSDNLVACVGANHLEFKIQLPESNENLRTIITVKESDWNTNKENSEIFDQVRLLADRNSSWAPQPDPTGDYSKGAIKIDNRIDNILRVLLDSPTTGQIMGYSERSTADNYLYLPIGRHTLYIEVVPDEGSSFEGPNKRFQIESESETTWIIWEDSIEGPARDATRLKVNNLTSDIQIMFEGDTELKSVGADSGGGVAASDEKIFSVAPGTSQFKAVNDSDATELTRELTIPDGKMVLVYIRTMNIEPQPPEAAAAGLSFTDSDLDAGEVGGVLQIQAAADESTIFEYVLYWGSDATTPLSGEAAITTLEPTGSDQNYTVVDNTLIPIGGSHFLVFTRNTYGETTTGISVLINDQ